MTHSRRNFVFYRIHSCNIDCFLYFSADARLLVNYDCGCSITSLFGDCFIDPEERPPKGYKCRCSSYGVGCRGTVVKCPNPHDYGCRGCAARECCIGSCGGYWQQSHLHHLHDLKAPQFQKPIYRKKNANLFKTANICSHLSYFITNIMYLFCNYMI